MGYWMGSVEGASTGEDDVLVSREVIDCSCQVDQKQ